MDIIHYLIKIVKYQGSQNETKEFNWQRYFNKFSQNEIKNDNLTIYDKNILDNLDVLCPDNLLKDNRLLINFKLNIIFLKDKYVFLCLILVAIWLVFKQEIPTKN